VTSVDVSDVSLVYPVRPPVEALRGVSMTIANGSLVAVLGPSGSGKTSLLRVLAGFERTRSGSITFGTTIVDDQCTFVASNRRHVGIVPQEGALFPHLDVAGNVGFGLQRLDRVHRQARVAELLDLVGLCGYERRRPRELSGGQQQRVALARALAPSPDVVLLDEPFSALDAALRSSVRIEVADLLRRSGVTALLVTHDRAEALAMADEVAVLVEGHIVQMAAPHELYRRPVDRATAELLGDVNVVPGVAHGRYIECALGRLALAEPTRNVVGGAVDVLVRPEQLVLLDSRPGGGTVAAVGPAGGSPGGAMVRATDGAAVSAEVLAMRFNGADTSIELRLPDASVVRARCGSAEPPQPGDRVCITVADPVWAVGR